MKIKTLLKYLAAHFNNILEAQTRELSAASVFIFGLTHCSDKVSSWQVKLTRAQIADCGDAEQRRPIPVEFRAMSNGGFWCASDINVEVMDVILVHERRLYNLYIFWVICVCWATISLKDSAPCYSFVEGNGEIRKKEKKNTVMMTMGQSFVPKLSPTDALDRTFFVSLPLKERPSLPDLSVL